MPRGGESAVAAPSPGHWLILADGGAVGEAVAGQLEAGGQSYTWWWLGRCMRPEQRGYGASIRPGRVTLGVCLRKWQAVGIKRSA